MPQNKLCNIPGIKSVTVENYGPDLRATLTGEDIPFICAQNEPRINVELELDGVEFTRLQEAMNAIGRSPGEQDLHDLKTMHNVLKCNGSNVSEKVTNYLTEKDEEVKNKVKAQKNSKKKLGRYQIKHR